jgi:protein arginine kinase activator
LSENHLSEKEGLLSMLCQICKKNEATVTIVRVVGMNKTELHVCNECANYLLGNTVVSFSFSQNNISEILSSLLDAFAKYDREENISISTAGEKCPNCGMTYGAFLQTGKLGCSQCYEVFRKQLNPLLGRLHGHSQHTGKVPIAIKEHFSQLQRIKEIKNELQQAVLKEEYEKAAMLRDEIIEEEERIRMRDNGR